MKSQQYPEQKKPETTEYTLYNFKYIILYNAYYIIQMKF